MSNGMQDLVTSEDRRRYYLERGLWDDATLSGRVRLWAAERPGATAVVDAQGRHTFEHLLADARRVATFLLEHGAMGGEVVSLQLPNRYEAVVLAVAAQGVGAVLNPLLPNYRDRELRHVFSTASPRLIASPGTHRGVDHVELVDAVAEATGVRPVHLTVGSGARAGTPDFESLLGMAPTMDLPGADASAVSEIIFTSGTEASPKAIMHTEQTASFSVRVAHHDLQLTDDDVVWMPSPVGHSTGFNYGLRFALHHGLPLVLLDHWDAEAALDQVLAEGCSYTLAATTFLQDLVAAAERRDAQVPRFRSFGCGGAPVPARLVEAAARRGIGVLRLYGSTEALVATWNRPASSPAQRGHTDGVAMTDVEIEVVDVDGRPVATGNPGEIVVRGPNTCVGFFADPERTATTFGADGWVRSGDLATLDERGYLTVVGRKKEIIIRGGMNITPREIEDLIAPFPEVHRVAVVGLPDDRLGERTAACVVLQDGHRLDLATVVGRLREAGLATYKLPESLHVLDDLPTTASGKVQKHEIVRALVASHGNDVSAPEPLILVTHRDLDEHGSRAAMLTLNRPDRLNAIDADLLAALDDALDVVEADRSVRAVLVTGAGRAFSAGGDLVKYLELQKDAEAFPLFVADLHRTLGRLRTLAVPVVALVNGVTAAGGLELVLNCDLAYIARSARIGDAHLNFGQMGGGGVLTLLPRHVGRQRASDLIFSGRFMSAEEAVAAGLVLEVVEDEALVDAGLAFAHLVAAKSPLAIANAKEVMHSIWADRLPVDGGLRYELVRNAYYCLTSDDAREGLHAFDEKRKPRFTGR